MAISIASVDAAFEREPLVRPFGFKGGHLREIWQVAARLESGSGKHSVGLGTQSVLWSDAGAFAAHSESGGNALMFLLTEHALQLVRGATFENPIDLLDSVIDELADYGRAIAGRKLRKTFILNALVPVDNAAWILYAKETGRTTFDAMIPAEYSQALAERHETVGAIPVVGYGMPLAEIEETVEAGYFFLKIKMGHPGSQAEMLERDKERLTDIHRAIGGRPSAHTADGKLPYYFDFNGRYEEKATLMRFLEHAEKIDALNQIAVLEEPFPEEAEIDVSDIDVLIAADESAHTADDVATRVSMGYSVIALKPIAKTLSVTLKMANIAHQHSVPCFCADLTVNPILVDWNKNLAARLSPMPGFRTGLLETNGHQNYRMWEEMVGHHPCAGASWMTPRRGLFQLDGDFYKKSGGIFMPSPHYSSLFSPQSAARTA